MIIENAEIESVRQIARDLGISLIEQTIEEPDIRVLIRPVTGAHQWRALSTGGRVKLSLCHHGQYAFMAEVLARFPDAVLKTWVNMWTLQLFEDAALGWTRNQILEDAARSTCDCTPEMIDAALRPPSARQEKVNR